MSRLQITLKQAGGLVTPGAPEGDASLFALFEKTDDYEAFERVLQEAWERETLPTYSYCIMRNHWHFVVFPETKNQLTDFFRWLTHTRTMRWHARATRKSRRT